jgi:soluble lytic murein transglycosylase-like protein
VLIRVKRIFLSLVAACPVFAGEYAVLQNGFRIHADRHEVVADKTRLHIGTGSMDVLTGSIVGFEVEEYVAPPPPPPPAAAKIETIALKPPPTPEEIVAVAAVNNGLRPEFVRSVAAVESAYRTQAVSPKGAIGLMQLMPGTAAELGADPHDPTQNADAGAKYLRQLLLRYKDTHDPVRLALAAYNAGPGAVDRYRNIPPYRETQQYVERVLRKYLAEMGPSSSR